MKPTRLHGLLLIMGALMAARLWDLRRDDKVDAVAEASPRASVARAEAPAARASMPMLQRERKSVRELDEFQPRNAFAVRAPPAPPPPPPAMIVPKPFVGPPLPPPPVPPPPPPFQVVGTWTDGQGLSVFLAGLMSTLQAREGDVLMEQYRVTRLTTQEVVIRQISSGQDTRLPLPISNPTPISNRP